MLKSCVWFPREDMGPLFLPFSLQVEKTASYSRFLSDKWSHSQVTTARCVCQTRVVPHQCTCSSSVSTMTSWAPTSWQAVTELCQFRWDLEKK